jgi:hypothetical protein
VIIARDEIKGEPKRRGKSCKRLGRRVGLTSLDPTDVRLRYARRGSELLLGEARGQALLEHACTDLEAGASRVQLTALFLGASFFDAVDEIIEPGAHAGFYGAGHR